MTDRLFCHTCVGTDQQHAAWVPCPDAARYDRGECCGAEYPASIWIDFAFSHAGQHVRKWSREPFEGGQPYSLTLPAEDAEPIITASELCAAVAAYDAERCRLHELWHGSHCEPMSDANRESIKPAIKAAILAAHRARLAGAL